MMSTTSGGVPTIAGRPMSLALRAATHSASSLRNSRALALRLIVDGSRPRSSQWRSRMAPLAASSAGSPHTFHSSANLAAIRSVRFSPPPPMSSGTGPGGLGARGASVIV